VTEDALSRRPDLEHTTNAGDMLSLFDPDEFGLPHPTGTSPALSLAAPLIRPSYDRPPMDHDGVLVLEPDISIDNIASVPLVSTLNGQAIRCTSLRAATEVPAPKPNAAPSRWKTGVMGILRYFSPPIENATAPQPAEQEWSHPVKDLPPAASGFDSPIHDEEDLCNQRIALVAGARRTFRTASTGRGTTRSALSSVRRLL